MSNADQREAAGVAEVLARVRAGVRQSHAARATQARETRPLLTTLEELRARQDLLPPAPRSHRGWLGVPIVFIKRVAYRFFMKWYLAPLVEQQNAFNRAATRAIEELAGAPTRDGTSPR